MFNFLYLFQEDDVSVFGIVEEYRFLMQFEKKIVFYYKVKSGKNFVMMIIKVIFLFVWFFFLIKRNKLIK